MSEDQQKPNDLPIKMFKIDQGIYGDENEPDMLILNAREVLEYYDIEVTQEALAAITAAFSSLIQATDKELMIIRDEDAPSIEEAVSDPTVRRCSKCGATYTDFDLHDCGLPEPDDGDVYSDADAPDPNE